MIISGKRYGGSRIGLIDQLICDEQSQNTGRDQEYRVSANIDFINQMRENLKSFSKGE